MSVCLRIANLRAYHDRGDAYRYVFVGPEGSWCVLTTMEGKELWRLQLIGVADADLEKVDIAGALTRCFGNEVAYTITDKSFWGSQDGGGRPLRGRPRVHRRRCGARPSAQWRPRHEHRHAGRVRPRLEACRRGARLGAEGAARELRSRAAPGLAHGPQTSRCATTGGWSPMRLIPTSRRQRRRATGHGAPSAPPSSKPTRSPGIRSASTSATFITLADRDPGRIRNRPTIRSAMSPSTLLARGGAACLARP